MVILFSKRSKIFIKIVLSVLYRETSDVSLEQEIVLPSSLERLCVSARQWWFKAEEVSEAGFLAEAGGFTKLRCCMGLCL